MGVFTCFPWVCVGVYVGLCVSVFAYVWLGGCVCVVCVDFYVGGWLWLCV